MNQFSHSISSGEKTSSTTILTGTGYVMSVLIITNGTNDAKVILYDNTAASGKVIFEGTVTGSEHFGGKNWDFPVKIHTGIYVAITGTGASAIVEYIPW